MNRRRLIAAYETATRIVVNWDAENPSGFAPAMKINILEGEKGWLTLKSGWEILPQIEEPEQRLTTVWSVLSLIDFRNCLSDCLDVQSRRFIIQIAHLFLLCVLIQIDDYW